MRRTHLAREGESVVVQVYSDHRIGTAQSRSLDDIEANSACAEYHRGLADAQLGVVLRNAEAGGDCTAEERRYVHVAVGRDCRDAIFRHHGILVEGSHPPRVQRLAAPPVFRGGGLDARTFAPVQHNLVARLDMTDARPGLDDRARTLMSQQVGEVLVLALGAVHLAELRAANAARVNLDE